MSKKDGDTWKNASTWLREPHVYMRGSKKNSKKRLFFLFPTPWPTPTKTPFPLNKKIHHVALPYRSSLEELFFWSNCGNEMSLQHLGRKKHIIFFEGQPFSIFLGGVSEFLWGKKTTVTRRFQPWPSDSRKVGLVTLPVISGHLIVPKRSQRSVRCFFFRFFVIIFMSHYRNPM